MDQTTGVWSLAGAEGFSSNFCIQTGSGSHPVGTSSSFPGIEVQPGHDTDHSPPSSQERLVAIPPLLLSSALTACTRDSFTLLLLVSVLESNSKGKNLSNDKICDLLYDSDESYWFELW
jgi:hypothetical protein